jgi:hypothetical protein
MGLADIFGDGFTIYGMRLRTDGPGTVSSIHLPSINATWLEVTKASRKCLIVRLKSF